MNRPSAGQATGLAGILVGAAAISTGLIAGVELNRQPHADVWSNGWLLTTVALAALAVFIVAGYFMASIFAHEEVKRMDAAPRTDKPPGDIQVQADADARPDELETAPADEPDPNSGYLIVGTRTDQAEFVQVGQTVVNSFGIGTWTGEVETSEEERVAQDEISSPRIRHPAFTGRWRHTADGFEASPLMNMTSLAMPGFLSAHGQEPQLRIGVSVACDPSPANASSSLYGAKLLDFLKGGPLASLIKVVIGSDEGLTWTRLAGNGPFSLEAVLCPVNQEDKPIASALLHPPVKGLRQYGRNEGTACLWLHIDLRGMSGKAPPAELADWYHRDLLAIAIPGAFAEFLTKDLGLRTYEDPAARVGVLIESIGPLSTLVDAGSLSPLPGAYPSRQFLGYAIADREGGPADQSARDLLQQLCDHDLHLADFEGVLDSIRAEYVDPDEPHAISPRPLGVGLGALLPPPPAEPLDIQLLDEDWDLWQGCAWIAAIRVRITNTSDKVIHLVRFELDSDPGPGDRPKLSQDQVDGVFHEMIRRADAYGSSHLARTDLQPGDSISGWLARYAYLPYPAKAGRPHCIFRVTDSVGGKYELEIPARSPQTRRVGRE
ncbi:MAG: hypothetical protein JWL68_2363 [Actinomycetia bacterium]|nr:hypothetical protein [Actinomycetes bacterium]